MKIITNTSSSKNGGIARRVREMIDHVQKQEGLELVVLEINPSEESRIVDRNVTYCKVPFAPVHSSTNVYHGLSNLDELHDRFAPLVEAIATIIDREQAQVALLEGTYYAPWCFYQAARRESLPRIHIYAGILSEEIKNWSPKKRELLKSMEREFYDPQMRYIFPSNLAKRKVEDEVFCRALPDALVIPNGISETFFSTVPATREDPVREGVGFVGRAAHVKNPSYLIALAEEFRRRSKPFQVHAIIDAAEDSKLARELRAAGVVMSQPVETEQLKDFYTRRTVIISPSFFETYGNVPAEALATRTPALVSSNMGVHEVFFALGLQRLIVDFQNIPLVVDAIESLVGEILPLELSALMRTRYSWTRTLDQYYAACRSCLIENAA